VGVDGGGWSVFVETLLTVGLGGGGGGAGGAVCVDISADVRGVGCGAQGWFTHPAPPSLRCALKPATADM